MTFAIIKDGAVDTYPIYQGEIETIVGYALPFDWQGGELNGVSYCKVHDAPYPETGQFENVSFGPPVYRDGAWWVSYIVTPWTAEEVAQYEARIQRLQQAKIALRDLGFVSEEVDRLVASLKELPQPTTRGLQEL